MTTDEFMARYMSLDISSKFDHLVRLQREFDKNKSKIGIELRNTQLDLIRWMRRVCFEDVDFMTLLP